MKKLRIMCGKTPMIRKVTIKQPIAKPAVPSVQNPVTKWFHSNFPNTHQLLPLPNLHLKKLIPKPNPRIHLISKTL